MKGDYHMTLQYKDRCGDNKEMKIKSIYFGSDGVAIVTDVNEESYEIDNSRVKAIVE
jgi:hypothetical protein